MLYSLLIAFIYQNMYCSELQIIIKARDTTFYILREIKVMTY